jgi:hypothetical protein
MSALWVFTTYAFVATVLGTVGFGMLRMFSR